MAERAAPILAGGNVFIAVGALHLPGNEGLIELLRKQGFTLTAVASSRSRHAPSGARRRQPFVMRCATAVFQWNWWTSTAAT